MPLPERLTLTAFPNYIFVYAQRQWVPPTDPHRYTNVALGRLIAEPDTAGHHKSYTNSRATETVRVPGGESAKDRGFN